MEKIKSTNGESGITTASKYTFGLLGFGIGLEVAGAAETFIGKVATVLGSTLLLGYAGKKAGEAVS
jgi:hypothetical protein